MSFQIRAVPAQFREMGAGAAPNNRVERIAPLLRSQGFCRKEYEAYGRAVREANIRAE